MKVPVSNKNKLSDGKRKKIKRIGITLLAVVFSFVSALVIIAGVFQDRIAAMFLSQLYHYTHAEITHSDVSFSVIRKFPMASLQINNICVNDMKDKKCLLQAEKIFLQFNMLDLLRNNYIIRKITLSHADLHLIIDEQGRNNWDIFQRNDTLPMQNVTVDLRAIQLNEVNFLFEHHRQKLSASALIDHLSAKGNFNEHVFTAYISSEAVLRAVTIDTTSFLVDQELRFYTKLHIDTEKNSYSIEDGNFDLGILKFVADMNVSKVKENYSLKTHLSIKHAAIEKIIERLPEAVANKTQVLKPKGILSGAVDIQGVTGKKNNLRVKAAFECKNGSIENTEKEVKLTKINLKGQFSATIPAMLSSARLVIEDFSAELNRGHISGKTSISNLEHPLVDVSLKGKLDMEELHHFLPVNYVDKIAGKTEIDISFQNRFTQLDKLTAQDFKNAVVQGSIAFSDVMLRIREDAPALENLSGALQFDNQLVNANKLCGKIKDIDFTLSGTIENVLPYIVEEGNRMNITADLYLTNLDMDKLLLKTDDQSTRKNKGQSQQELILPTSIDFHFKFRTDALRYKHFTAQNATGTAILKNSLLQLDNLQIQTCDGNIRTKGSIAPTSAGDFLLKFEADLTDVNIEKLFYAFDNFGQEYLTDKNIRGIVGSHVTFSARFHPNMSLVSNSISSLIDIRIRNGELNNFAYLESLSKFIELNELKNIRFATMENQISIEQRTLSIPAMEIKNNALNLTLSGKHTLSGEIDYHIKLLLKDVLARKRKAKQREDFGEVIDDNTGNMYLYLTATGTTTDPKFKWDTEPARKGLQQQFAGQKKQIQEIRDQKHPSSLPDKEKEQNNSSKTNNEIEIGDDW